MEKHIYNEQTGISYTLHGDYTYPISHSQTTKKALKSAYTGKGTCSHQTAQRPVYLNLLTTGKQRIYLADIDKQAEGNATSARKADGRE